MTARLLLDQMLPARLCETLRDLFGDVRHVRPLGLDRADDRRVWSYARDQGLTIVTKDADFQTLLALHGAPPKVVWLRLGNVSSASVERALRTHASTIEEFVEGEGACLIIR